MDKELIFMEMEVLMKEYGKMMNSNMKILSLVMLMLLALVGSVILGTKKVAIAVSKIYIFLLTPSLQALVGSVILAIQRVVIIV